MATRLGEPRARSNPRWALVLVLGGALAMAWGLPVRAQYSPNCERNGRRDYCAYTPPGPTARPSRDAGRLVFADHTVYALQRDEASCRTIGAVRRCRAWILQPPGSDRPIPATYVGTAFEGGYRHAYQSPRLNLAYSYLD